MKWSVLRLKDTEAVLPLRRNRFFICEHKDLAHRGSFVNGQVFYWSETEEYTANFSKLVALPPEAEAAVLRLFLQQVTLRAADPDRVALLRAANAFTDTLGRFLDQLEQDGLTVANNDLRSYDGVATLYAALRNPDDVAARSRLAALWKEALVQAHDLTRIENETFGLT